MYERGFNVYGNVSLWEDPYHEFCFMYNLCGMHVQCKTCNVKVQTIQKISCNFRKKIQNFPKNKYTGGQIHMNRSLLDQNIQISKWIYKKVHLPIGSATLEKKRCQNSKHFFPIFNKHALRNQKEFLK